MIERFLYESCEYKLDLYSMKGNLQYIIDDINKNYNEVLEREKQKAKILAEKRKIEINDINEKIKIYLSQFSEVDKYLNIRKIIINERLEYYLSGYYSDWTEFKVPVPNKTVRNFIKKLEKEKE